MTKFKNTIAGKILKGIGIGAAAVGGIALIGATGGAAAPGVGLLGKIALGAGKVVKGVVKGASVVGKTAVSLVTGTTKTEREQIGVIKGEAKAAQDQLDQVERLVKAGASYARAYKEMGITPADLGAADAEVKEIVYAEKIEAEDTGTTKTPVTSPLPLTEGGCLVTTMFLLSGLGAFVVGLLIIII